MSSSVGSLPVGLVRTNRAAPRRFPMIRTALGPAVLDSILEPLRQGETVAALVEFNGEVGHCVGCEAAAHALGAWLNENAQQILGPDTQHTLTTAHATLLTAPLLIGTEKVGALVVQVPAVAPADLPDRLAWAGRLLINLLIDRQTLEMRLQRDMQQKLLLHGVRDYAIYTLDAEGRVRTWNVGATESFGYAVEAVLGQAHDLFFEPDDVAAGVPAQLRAQAAQEGRVEYQGWRIRQDGTRFWADVVLTAQRDAAGQLQGFTVIARDLTDRKRHDEEIQRLHADLERRIRQRTAELEAANRELEAFSYSVSHDLRAPLRAIDGFARILADEYAARFDAEVLEFLQDIRSAATQMGRLVDDLLEFARLGRAAVAKRPLDPRQLVAECWEALAPERAGRQVGLLVEELPICQAEPSLLKQVWLNLLANALKFTRRREIARITVGFQRPDPGRLVYFVQDNGVGFDMRYANKLFGVFQRLHRADEYDGTGVGLAIVQRVIVKHGGEVWADSVPQEGATFSFSLPVEDGNE